MSLRSVPGIKCVVTDLDDTFWDSTAIPEQNIRVAAALKRLGIPLIPATGRSRHAVCRKLNTIGAAPFNLAPGVFNDGALVYGYDAGRPLHCITLSDDIIRTIESIAKQYHVSSLGWTTPKGLWGLKDAPWVQGDYTSWDERIFRVNSFEEVPHPRCSAFFSGPQYKELHDLIGSHPTLRDRTERVLYDKFDCVVVKSKGADKLHGVKLLAAQMGWNITEILVTGDGRNDIQMLEGFPYSLAMANGHKDAQSVATMVSDLGVSEGGWGHAIRKVLEIDASHIDNM